MEFEHHGMKLSEKKNAEEITARKILREEQKNKYDINNYTK
jgi:hypothetical protein